MLPFMQQHVHVVGIGGSAASGIAQIAAAQGFKVTGCDQAAETPYIEKARKAGIQTFVGHNSSHLDGVDIVAVSPALFYQNPDHPEITRAQETGRLMTWQAFMGEYLHRDKFVIGIAGTHGKSTTTTMVGILLEAAQMDPTVEVGATAPVWNNNVRVGKSEYFVTEADEFHDNFLNYRPDVIIFTNLELDHPEYFITEERMIASYQKFVDQLKHNGTIIYNADSPMLKKLTFPDTATPYRGAEFDAQTFPLSVPGAHNRANAQAVVTLARLLQIPDEVTAKALKSFTGIGRRIELLGEANGIRVYDDYANHPTEFNASINGVKELNPNAKVWAIIEPHTFSRLRSVLPDLPASVKDADEVLVAKIFASREKDPGDFTGGNVTLAMHHPHARYIPDFEEITKIVTHEAKPGDVILVMGSGDSYKLSRRILAALQQ